MSTAEQGAGSPKTTFGRGGAGNVARRDSQTEETAPVQVTPTLKTKIYTTGRGGTGNMAKNDYGAEAREAQDFDVPAVTLAEGQQHTGRGGAANKYTPSESEIQEAKVHNERVRRDSVNKQGAKEPGLKDLVAKGKEKLGN